MGDRGWVCDERGSHGAGVGGEVDGDGEERGGWEKGEGSEGIDSDGYDIAFSDLSGVWEFS